MNLGSEGKPQKGEEKLSIPSTWDFSMNRPPAVGSHLCVFNLSIPSTWDFSMNHFMFVKTGYAKYYLLSIPSTWDFSMNLVFKSIVVECLHVSFNSLYLGFFHESTLMDICGRLYRQKLSIPSTWDFSMNQIEFRIAKCLYLIFQFPLLGIFP